MKRIARGWGVGATLAVSLLGACAAISGLGSYSTDDCPAGCDASLGSADRRDASGDGGNGVTQDQASGSPIDAPDEGESASDDADDANESVDSSETADSGVALDAGVVDSGGGPEASDGACATTSSVENCSACGIACNASTGTPSCNGTTCSYTCTANRKDCNGATVPDTDGCECAGTGCCGTGCQTIHNSGLTAPANYYQCSSTGNTTQTQALAACTGSGGTGCSSKNTTCGGIFGLGGTSTSAACGTVAGTCYCWVYSGQNSGQVHTGGNGCSIPCSSGSTWN